jgi:beta-lactamase regulating signal transducer with metallopeptidase domain
VIFPLIAAAVALLACVLVGRAADRTIARMRPAQAVVLLAVAALAVSLASGIALTAIAVAVIATLASVASDGQWSPATIRAEVPIPGWVGALAAAAVVALVLRGAVRTTRILLALVRADRLCREIRAGGGPVVIVDDGSADAYTVAGIRGCVVISARLMAELSADERRVLTAHELSHLTRRHHLYVHIADIAAAGNPLLRPVSGAVRLGVERWADEDAAAGIGDRRIAGRALARVALLRAALSRAASMAGSPTGLVPVLGIGALQVASRVQALLEPAPRPRTARLALMVTMSLAVLLIGVASLAHIHQAIEGAELYLPRRR